MSKIFNNKIIFVLFLSLAMSVSAAVKIERLDIQQPRTFGYLIGDKLERVINLDLHQPYELDLSSLPKSGNLGYWLSVQEPETEILVENDLTKYKIKLTYQIINVKPGVDYIPLPSHNFLYKDRNQSDGEVFTALIPASRLGISMLTEETKKNIQPDQKPTLIPTPTGNIFRLLAFTLVALGCFAYLKWGMDYFNKNHPFAKAHKALSKLPAYSTNEDQHRQALETIHQAFNETAGRTVFAEKLDDFFVENQRFNSMQSSVEDFFIYSRKYFFEGLKEDDRVKYSISDLTEFAQKCDETQRGLA